MKYLLDTNVCIRYLNGTAPAVLRRLRGVPVGEVAVCSVVKAEMVFGAMKSTQVERTLERQRAFFQPFHSLPFDDVAAEHCGRIRAELVRSGQQIGPNDTMIAAIALAHGMILVTHNTGEFSRIEGLVLEDWEQE